MKNYAICPISNKRVDEYVARFNGLITLILLFIFSIYLHPSLILFLAIDFYFRSFGLANYSAVALISKSLVKLFSLQPKPINAGPKVFAARIGFVFTILVLLSSVLGLDIAAYVFTVIFAVCAFLEAAVGFCVACQIYPLVYKFFYQSKFYKL